MKLVTNQITDEIRQTMDRDDYEFCVQSFDVSPDGKKALVLGVYEDPDFPEVFIYNADTGTVRQVDGEDFIDVPLGKAFWAPNGVDFYINYHIDDTMYFCRLDIDTYKVSAFEEVEDRDAYIEAKLKEVLDLVHDDNNWKEPVVAPTYENKHHEFLVKLVSGFSSGVHARTTLLELFWSNEEPEVARKRALDALLQYRGHYGTMESLKRELGVDLDTSEVKAALDKLESLYKSSAEDAPA